MVNNSTSVEKNNGPQTPPGRDAKAQRTFVVEM